MGEDVSLCFFLSVSSVFLLKHNLLKELITLHLDKVAISCPLSESNPAMMDNDDSNSYIASTKSRMRNIKCVSCFVQFGGVTHVRDERQTSSDWLQF